MAEEKGSTGIFSSLVERSSGRLAAGLALATVVVVTLAVQASVLGHYFFGDDFVPLADIASRTDAGYIKALFLLNDETPNWRFLTGLFYLGAYRTFALDPLPYLLASVAVHVGTAALIFHFVRRAAGNIWLGLLAAALFGLTPASVPTVGQVTAINNVFGGFLLMLSLVLVYESFGRKHQVLWLAGSVLAFAAAVAANEALAVLAPAAPLVALLALSRETGWWRDRRRLTQWIAIAAPFAIIGGAALISLAACDCTSAAASDRYGLGGHMLDNLWLFLGRLLYPVRMEPLGDIELAHLVAGPVLAAIALAALVRGPTLARFAVLLLVLSLLPFLPLKLWSAPRYVYLATIPFSMLAAVAIGEVAKIGRTRIPGLSVVLALVVCGVLGLYGWQTVSQNEEFDSATRNWETLISGLQATYQELPVGSTVYVRGGALWNEPLLQCAVLPAVGEVVWGGVDVFFIYDLGARIRPGYAVFFVDAREEVFEDVRVPVMRPGEDVATVLPQIPPGTTGNLCREDVPVFP